MQHIDAPLLPILQALLIFPATYLACRGLFCAAANLTTCELIKRKTLPYLNHEVGLGAPGGESL